MNTISRLYLKILIASIVITAICAIFIVNANVKKLQIINDTYQASLEDKIGSLIELSASLENGIKSNEHELSEEDFLFYTQLLQANQKTAFISFLKDNTIQHVHPSDDFKHLIGTNGILPNEDTWYSQMAIATNNITIFTYYEPVSRQDWLMIKNPIFSSADRGEGEFLGFITIAFLYDALFETVNLSNLDELGYTHSLSILHGETKSRISQSKKYTDLFSKKNELNIYGTKWNFAVKASLFSLFNPILLVLIFLSLRFIYYSIIVYLQKKEAKKQELNYQQYVDSLTGAFSRKKLETLLDETKCATLIYITINDLKNINEEHGRDIGDGLLIAYSKRLQYNVKNGFVVRLGGSEFVVVLEGEMQKSEISGVIQRIKDLSKQPFGISGVIISIVIKIGHAEYPKDSSTFAKLLSVASDRQQKS